MAPLAERLVRVRYSVDQASASALRKATSRDGATAGRDFAKAFKTAVGRELRGTDFQVKVRPDMEGFKRLPKQAPIKVPMVPDDEPLKRAPRTKIPKVPVELDPLVSAFQADVRRQLATLARQAATKIPVTADTDSLRAALNEQFRVLGDKAKLKVAVDAPDKADVEASLRTVLADVQAKVRQAIPPGSPKAPKIPVRLDPLATQFQAKVRQDVAALARQINAQIPVNADTEGIRRDVAQRIADIEAQTKVKIDVDSPGGAAHIARLRRQLEDLQRHARVNLRIDTDRSGSAIGGLNGAIQSLSALAAGVGLQGISRGLQLLTGAAGNAGSAVTNLSTSMTAWIPLLFAGAVALSTLPAILGTVTAAVYALAGALASMPALAAGLGASIGVLGLGFMGLGDHFKQTAGGGGGAARSMAGLRAATRNLAHAQRDLLKATEAVNKAREEEIERISDLSRALRGAELDVADAEVALNAARRGTDSLAIRRAALDLEEAQDRYADLAAEKAKADRVGVEGSDAVQDALERQADAMERLTEAQIALKEAQQRAGGGGGGKELLKLAPAAQDVVDTIKKLKPAFEDLRLSVQQRLFAGVAGEIRDLARVWFPALKVSLGDYADTFNSIFKTFSRTVQTPQFIADIQAGLESVRQLINKVGQAVAGPLTKAFGTLSRAAAPFIAALGDKLAGLVTKFADWIEAGNRSGGLQRFFERSAQAFKDIWSIGGSVLSILGSLFQIFTGSAYGKASDNIFEGMRDSLQSVADWLKDPENQDKVRQFLDSMGQAALKISEIITRVDEWTRRIDSTISTIERWAGVIRGVAFGAGGAFSSMGGTVAGVIGFIAGQLGRLPGIVASLGGRISAAAGGMFAGIATAFRNAINQVIAMWNRLQFNVPSVNIPVLGRVGGGSIGVQRVPFLASGGVVQARPGGTLANLAEAGEDEAVLPLSKLDAMLQAAAGNNGGDIVIPVYLFPGAAELDRVVIGAAQRNPDAIARAVKRGDRRLAYAG